MIQETPQDEDEIADAEFEQIWKQIESDIKEGRLDDEDKGKSEDKGGKGKDESKDKGKSKDKSEDAPTDKDWTTPKPILGEF